MLTHFGFKQFPYCPGICHQVHIFTHPLNSPADGQAVYIKPPGYLASRNRYVVRKASFTYKDRMTISLGDEIYQLMHVASRTPDETVIYMPRKKVVFTGDTVCTNGIPGLGESCLKEWLGALEFIEGLDFDALVPGHGEPGDKDSVRHFQRKLDTLADKVRKHMESGLSRDEIIDQTRYTADIRPLFQDILTAS